MDPDHNPYPHPHPHPHLTISPPTPSTLPSLIRLTKTLLPIKYPPRFFEGFLQPCSAENGFSIARVAIWDASSSSSSSSSLPSSPSLSPYTRGDEVGEETGGTGGTGEGVVIGGISGRLQMIETEEGKGEWQLYIATLCVLAPWRGQGVGGVLLRELVRVAMREVARPGVGGGDGDGDGGGEKLGLGKLTSVYAHVWETNESALDWYRGQGFEVGDVIRGYYRRLKPDGGRVVRRGTVGLVASASVTAGADVVARTVEDGDDGNGEQKEDKEEKLASG